MKTIAPTESPLFHGEQLKVNTPNWLQYFQQMHDYYSKVLIWTDPYAVGFGKAEPTPKVVGLLGYANGTDWNPSGAGTVGYYRWNGAAWVLVG